ncbi:MAG: radical SAM protein, partial [Proteobacteria bacterium]|nr:radical SAM protein [Pseudomonadota bacterium]
MKYKYVFGPVPSRRLGVSLGIDLIPYKVCSYNCIYCECGKTTDLTIKRKEYVPTDIVLKEIDDYVKNHPAPDFITFSGSGEPTLHSKIGLILSHIKSHYPSIKTAVLTNGSLLYIPDVRKEILAADVVLPSLDAALNDSFIKINRPNGQLRLEKIISGLIDFRKEYKGEIWLEIFIVEGINTDNDNLDALKNAIVRIKPDKVQLNTLDRPGTEDWVKPASKKTLESIIDYWGLPNVKIISKYKSRKDIKSYRNDVESMILETIRRRPCTLTDLSAILGLHINELNKYLDVLEAEK